MHLAPLLLLFASIQEPVQDALLPVRLSGRTGYLNPNTQSIEIPFQFEAGGRFQEGLAAARQEGRWGFLDREGRWAIEPRFARVEGFREGFAAVAENRDGVLRMGHIDRSGRPLGQGAVWARVGSFHEGRAAVWARGRSGYVDTDGELVIELNDAVRLPDAFRFGVGTYLSSDPDKPGVAVTRTGSVVFRSKGELSWSNGAWIENLGGGRVRLLEVSGEALHDGHFFMARAASEGDWAAVFSKEGWRYMNHRGQPQLDRHFLEAKPFSGGVAAVQRYEHLGYQYIDTDGVVISGEDFEYAGPMIDGYAIVKLDREECWLDRNGQIVWNPKQQPIQEWERELAKESQGETLAIATDPDGIDLEIQPQKLVEIYRDAPAAIDAARLHDGDEILIPVGENTGTCYLYSTSWVLPEPMESAIPQREFFLVEEDPGAQNAPVLPGQQGHSMAIVFRDKAMKSTDGLLQAILKRELPNLVGKLRVDHPKLWMFRPGFDVGGVALHELKSNVASFASLESELPEPEYRLEGEGMSYYFSDSLEPAFEGVFQRAMPFRNGYARVMIADRWGFIDEKGRWAIQPRFAVAGDFSEGLAIVAEKTDGPLGFTDPTDRIVIPCIFETLGSFHEQRALFLAGDQWGYLDPSGKKVIPAQYEWAGDFGSGLAPVQRGGKVGYIDTSGEQVFDFQFAQAGTHVEGLAKVVTPEGIKAFLDVNGKPAFVLTGDPLACTNFMRSRALIGGRDGKWALIDPKGEIVVGVEPVQ